MTLHTLDIVESFDDMYINSLLDDSWIIESSFLNNLTNTINCDNVNNKRKRRTKASLPEKILICEQYKNGLKLKKISAYFSLSENTILSILKEMNIQLRCTNKTRKEQELYALRLYKEGKSILDIIEQTGIKSSQTIYRILKDYGVKRRRNMQK